MPGMACMTTTGRGLRLATVLLLLATRVAAQDETEFAFDLFSDIAPIFALFGEQFATQFASESLTWLDHLIFAMVPLGILSMISGAIRVAGPRLARSFIGRARENRALAEIQLMSSTSREVCELFNGRSIIRAMGTPKLAEFLIFPNDYNELERNFKDFDKIYAKAPRSAEPPIDTSCGIHSVFTTTKLEKGRKKVLMKFIPYHSYSYNLVKGYLNRLKSNKTSRSDEESPGNPAQEKSYDFLGPPNLQLNLSSDHFEDGWLKKGHELFLAGVFAVAVQLGLIAIAAATVFHESTRAALSPQPKTYGFPCYVAGSFLLSLGMGICSLAVEQSTVENMWKRSKEKSSPSHNKSSRDLDAYPRLMWLQQGQTVNDQTFEPYAILAGPKRYVVSSSRIEDARGSKSEPKAARRRGTDLSATGSSSGDTLSEPEDLQADKFRGRKTWEFISVFGVFAAALGFVAQFIGLRGLAFPCSIAQVVAILVMVLVRTIIRRGLGKTPGHARALAGHELDFLATCIVYCPEFRTFHRTSEDNPPCLQPQSPNQIYQWRVATATLGDANAGPFLFLLPEELAALQRTPDSASSDRIESVDVGGKEALWKGRSMRIRARQVPPLKRVDTKSAFDDVSATSQQLLRVRARLQDLCEWDSKASEIASSLAQSIELFMNTFPLEPFSKQRADSLDWVVDTRPPAPSSTAQYRDSISISITRPAKSAEWEVNLSAIEAVISLWMASIEAKMLADKIREIKAAAEGESKGTSAGSRKTTDRRRAKVGSATKYRFCRILGDNFKDGVLKRDMSWWVDELHLLANESDTLGDDYEEDGHKDEPNTGVEWTASRARASDVKLIIGFNGRPEEVDRRRRTSEKDRDRPKELAIVQSDFLPTILAQHLFTSFMWTVSERLPRGFLRKGFSSDEQDVEIDGPHKFVPYHFAQTWHRPTLRHRQLTKVVRQMEKIGLGSTNDILMCMIPALSFKDLLPNQPMLELLPQVGSGQGWVETARCYNRLLETPIGTTIEEDFCYAVVVKTMDFLHLACEPYDDSIRPSPELNDQLKTIVETLSSKFVDVVSKLIPIFNLQQRGDAFRDIFASFGYEELRDLPDNFPMQGNHQDDEYMNLLERKLGFSKGHRKVCGSRIKEKEKAQDSETGPGQGRDLGPTSFGKDGNEAVMSDIFGWTPLHYACLARDAKIFEKVLEAAKQYAKDRPVHKILDEYQRSPIHVAAFGGNKDVLETMINEFKEDKTVLSLPGIDRMTPLHLATRVGNHECVDKLIKASHEQSISDLDIWGREALHIASSCEHYKIASLLLKSGSAPDRKDEIGKSPLDYLLKDGRELRDLDGDGGQTEETKKRSEDIRSIFLEMAKNAKAIKFKDENGKTFLHYAVEFADEGTIRELLQRNQDIEAQDRKGRTPLHTALLVDRSKIAMELINGSFNGKPANPTAKDRMGVTALMFASQKGMIEVATRLLKKLKPAEVQAQDEEGRTALHHSLSRETDAMMKLLIEGGCDPTARDAKGRSALHDALIGGKDDFAEYLLGQKLPETLEDKDGESLLISACKSGCEKAVQLIVEKRPELINYPDSTYDQTPLSFACEHGRGAIVNILLDVEGLDRNLPARRWHMWSPLHVAAYAGDPGCITSLLNKTDVSMDMKDDNDETPLILALSRSRGTAAKAILVHERTSDDVRIEHLTSFCAHSASAFHGIFADVLKAVNPKSLTTDKAVEFVEASARLANPAMLEASLGVAITERGAWKQIKLPCLLAARVGNFDIVEELAASGADPTEVDEDGWSCADYAARFGHGQSAIDRMSKLMSERSTSRAKPEHKVPTVLEIPEDLRKTIAVGTLCDMEDHVGCQPPRSFHVKERHPALRWASLRTSKCIPPPGQSTKNYFYFEVTIQEDSKSRIIGVGYCGENAPVDDLPGCFQGSWAYHGDDGGMFTGTGLMRTSSRDFGDSGKYSAGDVVGVGLDLLTGEGFCTLNGEKRDVGDTFKENKFSIGKFYPCVGVQCVDDGVGLQFTVNLGRDERHPFVYRGPFP